MKKIPLIMLAGMISCYALAGYAAENKEETSSHISFYDKNGEVKTLPVICMERDTYDNNYGKITSCGKVLIEQSFVGLNVNSDNTYGKYYAAIKIAGKQHNEDPPVLLSCQVPQKITNPTLLKILTKRKDTNTPPDVDCCFLLEKDVYHDVFTNCRDISKLPEEYQ